MKKFALLAGMITLGLLGLNTGSVQAAASTNELISTFAIVGLFAPTNNPVITTNASGTVITAKLTAKAVKIATKDLLNLLATEFNTNFPAGAQLAMNLNSGSRFVVLDKNGNLLLDVSTNAADSSYVFGTTNFTDNVRLMSGKETETKTSTETNMTATITMTASDIAIRYADGNGNDFHFSGVLSLKQSLVIGPNIDNIKKASAAGRLSGSGGGIFYNPADSNYDEGVFTKVIWKAAGKGLVLD
jgi:hypothetical protein